MRAEYIKLFKEVLEWQPGETACPSLSQEHIGACVAAHLQRKSDTLQVGIETSSPSLVASLSSVYKAFYDHYDGARVSDAELWETWLIEAQLRARVRSEKMLHGTQRAGASDYLVQAAINDQSSGSHSGLSLCLPKADLESNDIVELSDWIVSCSNPIGFDILDLSWNSISEFTMTKLFTKLSSVKSCPRELVLSNMKLSDACIVTLAKALHSAKVPLASPKDGQTKEIIPLAVFDLRNSKFSTEGAKALAPALQIARPLHALLLDQTPLGDEGSEAILSALSSNVTGAVQQLSLNDVAMKDSGAEALSNTISRHGLTLEMIVVSNNPISADGAMLIAKAFVHLRVLQTFDANGCALWQEEAGESLAECIQANPVLLPSIRKFRMVGCSLSKSLPAMVKCLAQCPNLDVFDVSNNAPEDKCAEKLADGMTTGFSKLRAVGLWKANVSDKNAGVVLRPFRTNTLLANSITILNLSMNSIGEEGALDLKRSLSFLPSLEAFLMAGDFDTIGVGEQGAKAIADGLCSCTRLKALCLRYQKIGAPGAIAMAKVLYECTGLTSLDLSKNWIETPDTPTSTLNTLCERFAFCPSLITMNHFSPVPPLAVGALHGSFPKLQQFHRGYRGAMKHPFLGNIFDEVSNLTDDLKIARRNTVSKSSLSRRSSTFIDPVIDDVMHFTSKRTHGHQSASNPIEERAERETVFLKGFEEDFWRKVSVLELKGVLQEPSYEAMFLASRIASISPWLRLLDLSQNSMPALSGRSLGQAFVNAPNLTCLNLSQNRFMGQGIRFIVSGLSRGCSSLTSLNLRANFMADEGTEAVAACLPALPGLMSLDVSTNGASSKSLEKLGRTISLGCCPLLAQLNNVTFSRFTYNIGWGAGKMLTPAVEIGFLFWKLKSHTTPITSISLSKADLKYEHVKELFKSIRFSQELQKLDLSQNSIRSLPSTISVFRKLELLDVSNNDIKELPNSLGLLKLKSLKVFNNDRMPEKFKSMQCSELCKSLRDDFFKENKRFLGKPAVFVVGAPACGKTHLVRSLASKKGKHVPKKQVGVEVSKSDDSGSGRVKKIEATARHTTLSGVLSPTLGIDVHEIELQVPQSIHIPEDVVHAKFYDCGGSDIYSAMMTKFCRNSSLALLVWDCTVDIGVNCRVLERRLHQLQSASPSCKALLVATRGDEISSQAFQAMNKTMATRLQESICRYVSVAAYHLADAKEAQPKSRPGVSDKIPGPRAETLKRVLEELRYHRWPATLAYPPSKNDIRNAQDSGAVVCLLNEGNSILVDSLSGMNVSTLKVILSKAVAEQADKYSLETSELRKIATKLCSLKEHEQFSISWKEFVGICNDSFNDPSDPQTVVNPIKLGSGQLSNVVQRLADAGVLTTFGIVDNMLSPSNMQSDWEALKLKIHKLDQLSRGGMLKNTLASQELQAGAAGCVGTYLPLSAALSLAQDNLILDPESGRFQFESKSCDKDREVQAEWQQPDGAFNPLEPATWMDISIVGNILSIEPYSRLGGDVILDDQWLIWGWRGFCCHDHELLTGDKAELGQVRKIDHTLLQPFRNLQNKGIVSEELIPLLYKGYPFKQVHKCFQLGIAAGLLMSEGKAPSNNFVFVEESTVLAQSATQLGHKPPAHIKDAEEKKIIRLGSKIHFGQFFAGGGKILCAQLIQSPPAASDEVIQEEEKARLAEAAAREESTEGIKSLQRSSSRTEMLAAKPIQGGKSTGNAEQDEDDEEEKPSLLDPFKDPDLPLPEIPFDLPRRRVLVFADVPLYAFEMLVCRLRPYAHHVEEVHKGSVTFVRADRRRFRVSFRDVNEPEKVLYEHIHGMKFAQRALVVAPEANRFNATIFNDEDENNDEESNGVLHAPEPTEKDDPWAEMRVKHRKVGEEPCSKVTVIWVDTTDAAIADLVMIELTLLRQMYFPGWMPPISILVPCVDCLHSWATKERNRIEARRDQIQRRADRAAERKSLEEQIAAGKGNAVDLEEFDNETEEEPEVPDHQPFKPFYFDYFESLNSYKEGASCVVCAQCKQSKSIFVVCDTRPDAVIVHSHTKQSQPAVSRLRRSLIAAGVNTWTRSAQTEIANKTDFQCKQLLLSKQVTCGPNEDLRCLLAASSSTSLAILLIDGELSENQQAMHEVDLILSSKMHIIPIIMPSHGTLMLPKWIHSSLHGHIPSHAISRVMEAMRSMASSQVNASLLCNAPASYKWAPIRRDGTHQSNVQSQVQNLENYLQNTKSLFVSAGISPRSTSVFMRDGALDFLLPGGGRAPSSIDLLRSSSVASPQPTDYEESVNKAFMQELPIDFATKELTDIAVPIVINRSVVVSGSNSTKSSLYNPIQLWMTASYIRSDVGNPTASKAAMSSSGGTGPTAGSRGRLKQSKSFKGSISDLGRMSPAPPDIRQPKSQSRVARSSSSMSMSPSSHPVLAPKGLKVKGNMSKPDRSSGNSVPSPPAGRNGSSGDLAAVRGGRRRHLKALDSDPDRLAGMEQKLKELKLQDRRKEMARLAGRHNDDGMKQSPKEPRRPLVKIPNLNLQGSDDGSSTGVGSTSPARYTGPSTGSARSMKTTKSSGILPSLGEASGPNPNSPSILKASQLSQNGSQSDRGQRTQRYGRHHTTEINSRSPGHRNRSRGFESAR